MKKTLIIFLFVFLASTLHAAFEARDFKSPEQEALFKELTAELRCLVCQNQNLAGSNAELALDLKQQVYLMITERDMSRDEIVKYMVDRYGDFVLYKPPFKASTLLLWLGPLLLLMLGIFLMWKIIRENSSQPKSTVSDEKLKDIRSFLDDKGERKS